MKNGAFCKYCVIFAKSGGVGNQPLGNFVTIPFNNWKKAKEILLFNSYITYFYNFCLN